MTVAEPDTAVTADAPAASAVRFRRVWYALLGVTLLLSLASLAVPQLVRHPLTRDRGEVQLYLDVGEEGNLPTWWSVGLLVAAALAHLVVGLLARVAGSRVAWAWFGSAGVLAAMSLDDHTSLHERLDRIGKLVVTMERFPFYWLVPGVVIAAAVAAALLTLAIRLRGRARWHLVAGCLLMLGAATGGELLQGLQLADGGAGPLYILTFHAEELAENIGVLLMLAAAACSAVVTVSPAGPRLSYRG